MMSEHVNPKDLFQNVSEGDEIMFGDRTEPVTVYRHVTEDDHAGQVITMSRVTEEHAETAAYEVERGEHENDAIRAGDLMTGELTGDEFLIARGPRGGCYLLEQWWSKNGGQWSASIALYRRARAENEVWTWENSVDVEVVGSSDVDRSEFDEGGDWTRHTEVQGEDVTVWADTRKGEAWDHSEDLTGTEPRDPTDTGAKPWEVLETVSEGDHVTVNGRTGTVTEVTDEYSGALTDGVTLTVEGDGDEFRVRTFADEIPAKGKAHLMGKDMNSEDVTDVAVNPEDEDSEETDEDPEPVTDGGEEPREVLQDVREGQRLTLHTADGDVYSGEVSEVVKYRAEHPGERDHLAISFSVDPGVEHRMSVYLDRNEPVTLIQPMFADTAAERGHIPEDEVTDPDDAVDVEKGEVVRVERGPEVRTDGGEGPDGGGHVTERVGRVDDLRDLNVGDEVIFDERKQPLTVTEDTTSHGASSWTGVALEGPNGGVVTLKSVPEGMVRVSAVDREVANPSPGDGAREPITHVSLYFHLREICQGSPAERNPDGLDELTAREALHSPDPVAFLAAVARDPYRALHSRHTAETLLSHHVTQFWFMYRCPNCMEAESLLNWADEDSHEPQPRCPCGRKVPVPNYPGEDSDGSRSDRGARHAGPRV